NLRGLQRNFGRRREGADTEYLHGCSARESHNRYPFLKRPSIVSRQGVGGRHRIPCLAAGRSAPPRLQLDGGMRQRALPGGSAPNVTAGPHRATHKRGDNGKSMSTVHIGTSGWHYPHWRGPFYPEKMPGSRMLDFYTQHFDTVELNNTFYRLPVET